MTEHRYFPMFIDSEGKEVLVVGGGSVAERRILTLLEFSFSVTVVAEKVTDRLRALAADGRFRLIRGRCAVAEEETAGTRQAENGSGAGPAKAAAGSEEPAGSQDPVRDPAADPAVVRIDALSADLILACTDDRQLNRQIGAYARRRGIPVNVCDAREESGFWFPAVALNEELTMGLVGNGRSHDTVRNAAAALREIIEERKYER